MNRWKKYEHKLMQFTYNHRKLDDRLRIAEKSAGELSQLFKRSSGKDSKKDSHAPSRKK